MNTAAAAPLAFSGYQKLVVGMLAFLQFAVILDFMLMSPLGAVIMPALSSTPVQFGGLASLVAGHIVKLGADGKILHYDIAGYVVITTSLLTAFLLWKLQRESIGGAIARA